MNTLNLDPTTSDAAVFIKGLRAFQPGQHVRTYDGLTGYIYEDNGAPDEDRPYQIAIYERDEERSVSASEVTLWVPNAGDRIVERSFEDGEKGEFLHMYGDGTCVVKWDTFPLPQIVLCASLEPACS